MAFIILDVYESDEMNTYLSQTLQVFRQNLVPTGMADIMWNCGHTITLEHKTIEQAMTEMGGRLDQQLYKHSHHADEVGLVIDGVVMPVPGEPACYLYKYQKVKRTFTQEMRKRHGKLEPKKIYVSWEAFQAYLWRLDKEGFTVYQAPTLESLCLGISAFVHNSLKPEHQSLRRYIKSKPVIWEEKDQPIYFWIKTLMVHAGVGEAMARKLLEAYGTPWEVFRANPLDGKWPAGESVFNTIQADIGRDF